jgi:1-acyl-sn-glycerol-3-phosphate acyltransferase
MMMIPKISKKIPLYQASGKDFSMLRSIIIVLTIAIFLILGLPLLLIETIIGKFNPQLMQRSSLRIVQAVLRLIMWETGSKVTVIGEENIPKDRPVLYISNHRSYFDVVLMYPRVVGLCGFIAKQEINKVPILGLWMRKLNCLFLERDNIKQGLDTILKAIDMVKSGISIQVCPEGTRNHEEEMLPFKDGSFKIAEKTGCPIVPIAITGSDDIYENHRPFVRPANVTIRYGEPIYLEGMDRSEKKRLGPKTQAIIADMICEIKEQGSSDSLV